MDLSIIIVTYNSEKYILNCLNSIAKAIQNIKHEIFIIDNNSKDQTKTLIKSFSNSLVLIENKENFGFVKAINMVLERTSGEIVLLVNPDVIIKSDSLWPIIDFIRSNPSVGICGCKLLNEDGSLQYSKGSFPTLFSTISGMILPKHMRKYHLRGYNKGGECDWVTGAFMMIRGDTVNEVGPLDDRYFMYYEDVDYCLQAKKKGWLTYYFPAISAYHLNPHARLKKNADLFLEKEIRKSQLLFFKKNNSQISYPLLFFGVWVFSKCKSILSRSEKNR